MRLAIAVVLLVTATRAFAEGEPVVFTGPARLADPCPRGLRPMEWAKLPEGGPPNRQVAPSYASFDGKRVLVRHYSAAVAYDPCAGTWAPAAAPPPVAEGRDLGGVRFVPGHDPRESSYDGFATARVILPSGREVRARPEGAPSPRTFQVMAFDGRRMLVWGGWGPLPGGKYGTLGDGAMLDTRTGRWKRMSDRGAPSPRFLPVAAWTGARLVVWGGGAGVPGGEPSRFVDGAVYDPARDVWSPMSDENAPPHRWKPVIAATGKVLVMAGGGDILTTGGARGRDDAWIYDPAANRWSSVQGAPKLSEASWVRTFVTPVGNVVYVDTHQLRSFGLLDPGARRWGEIPLPTGWPERSGVAAAWTGARLFLWGGYRQVPGYVDPCRDFKGPGGCDPPSPHYEIFRDGYLIALP